MLSEELRTAEVRKLQAGLSNLIDLNIREIQVATAARDLVRAQRDYFRALAEYRARIAIEDHLARSRRHGLRHFEDSPIACRSL